MGPETLEPSPLVVKLICGCVEIGCSHVFEYLAEGILRHEHDYRWWLACVANFMLNHKNSPPSQSIGTNQNYVNTKIKLASAELMFQSQKRVVIGW